MIVKEHGGSYPPLIQLKAAAILLIEGDRIELYVEGTLTATIDNMTRRVTLTPDWDATPYSIHHIRVMLCELAEVDWDDLTAEIIRPYLEPIRPDDAAAYYERNHLAAMRDLSHQSRPRRTEPADQHREK